MGVELLKKINLLSLIVSADKSRTNKAHFGLGLSIAKELAKMLSGKIGFSDTSGGGTTFFLTLPIK